MTTQMAFDWPRREALGAEDFFVTEANAAAHAMVMNPSAWPEGKLVLVGPAGSGKTHLARLFAQSAGAERIDAAALASEPPLPAATAAVIEDADRLPRSAETALFHLHNHLVGPGRTGRLLLTARTAPGRWDLTLPDLASRMQATGTIGIDQPDDALLGAVLMKQFQDRQLAPTPAAFAFLLKHVERSFAAARAAVDRLDRLAMARQTAITRDLVRDVLDTGHDEAQ